MAKAFARQTKLGNIVGRSEYITDQNRQEEIIFHSKKHLKNPWEDYAKFEKENQRSKDKNNEGREIIIALPHELENDSKKLEKIIDEYSLNLLGENRDFEYAVHWNKKKTNLHAHIIYSERERITERKPKRYKRDMWFNIENNRMAKANSENAVLRFKKGEIMKDKEGNIRYDSNPFTKKDTKFKARSFNEEIKKELKNTLNRNGFKYRLFNPKKEIPQIHVGHKKSRRLETYKNLKDYNQEINQLNLLLSKTKTTPEFFKAVFGDLRFNDKEDWQMPVYEKTKVYSDLSFKIINKNKEIDKNKSDIQEFYKKIEKRKEIMKELDKVSDQEYTKWNFIKAPVDFVVRKMMEKNLEKLDIEREYHDYLTQAKVYSNPTPTPMHKNIARLEKEIQELEKEVKDLKEEIRERKEYKEDYPGIVRIRKIRERKEKEKSINREKEQIKKPRVTLEELKKNVEVDYKKQKEKTHKKEKKKSGGRSR